MKPIHLYVLISLFSLAFVAGCDEEKATQPTTVLPPQGRTGQLFAQDTVIAAVPAFRAGISRPTIQFSGQVRLATLADSSKPTWCSLTCNNSRKDTAMTGITIKYGTSYLLNFTWTIDDLSPITELLQVRLTITYKNHTGERDSTQLLSFDHDVWVNWSNINEPGLRRLNIGPGLYAIGGFRWSPAGDKLYFNTDHYPCMYNFADSTLHPIQFQTTSQRMLDLSHDGRSLLIAENNARPSGLWLYDIATQTQRTLIEPPDSVYIITGAFSGDDSRIIFTGPKLEPVVWQSPVWLFSRSDSTVRQLTALAPWWWFGSYVIRWFPNSNERFLFFNQQVGIYSLYDSTTTPLNLPPDWNWWHMLDDGYSMMALRTARTVNYSIAENHVWLTNVFGQTSRQLTFHPQELIDFSVSPDGRTLLISGSRSGVVGVWVLPLEGVIGRTD